MIVPARREARPDCSQCQGTGWEHMEGSNLVRRCHCVQEERISSLHEKSRIPARYAGCTLESYDGLDPSQKRAKAIIAQYAEQFPLIDEGLLFLGPCGVGKTHLAVALIRELTMKGIACLFYDFRDLLREIQNTYNSISKTSELEVLEPILHSEVLVLDELGANKPTDWVRDTVTHIINTRYNEKRTTIFTSNFLDTPQRQGEESLTDRIGARLRSRLYEMSRVVEISGKDYRQYIKQAQYRSFRQQLE
jgi:DNA replication protein DnaC